MLGSIPFNRFNVVCSDAPYAPNFVCVEYDRSANIFLQQYIVFTYVRLKNDLLVGESNFEIRFRIVWAISEKDWTQLKSRNARLSGSCDGRLSNSHRAGDGDITMAITAT